MSTSSSLTSVTGAVITRAGSQANIALEVGPRFPNHLACFETLDPETHMESLPHVVRSIESFLGEVQ